MGRQQSYQNRNKGFFGKVVNRVKALFITKKVVNKITKPVYNESKPSPKRIRRRRNLGIFGCKAKLTNCAVKQFAQMKHDHGHLWSGTLNNTQQAL